jgi:cell filamentation protein
MHAELLYLHPFREGNGRIIRLFTRLISLVHRDADIDFEPLTEEGTFERYVAAVQQAAQANYAPMRELFGELCP